MTKTWKLRKNLIVAAGTLALCSYGLLVPNASYAVTPSATEAELDTARRSETNTSAEIEAAEAAILTAHNDLANVFAESMAANNAYSEALVVADEKNNEYRKALETLEESEKKLDTVAQDTKKIAVDAYKNMGPNNPLHSITLDPDTLRDVALSRIMENRNSQRLQSALQASNTAKNLADNAEDAKKAAEEAKTRANTAKVDAETAQKNHEESVRTAEQNRETLIEKLAALRNSTVEIERRHTEELERQREQQYLKDLETQAPQQPGAPALIAPPPSSPSPQPPVVSPPSSPSPQPPVVSPPPSQPEPPNPPTVGGYQQTVISFMRARLGQAYEWGGTGPWGYDCSGLTQAAFASAGIGLPRVAHAQFMAAPVKVPLSQMQPGDLLVWGPPSYFTHIAVYLGNGQVIHAFNPTDGITITPLAWMSHMGLYPQAARF